MHITLNVRKFTLLDFNVFAKTMKITIKVPILFWVDIE